MAMYLGYQPRDDQSIAPALASRGIHLLRAPPGQVEIVISVSRIQLGYKFYTTVLPAYMAALVTQRKQDLKDPYFPVQFPLDKVFPFSLPTLVLSFDRPPSSQALEKLSEIGYEKVKVRGKEIYKLVGAYTLEEARQVKQLGARDDAPAPRDTMNLHCIGPLVAVLKIFSNFLAAHTYAAFPAEDAETAAYDDILASEVKGVKRKAGQSSGARDEDAEMEPADAASPGIRFYAAKPPSPDRIGWGPSDSIPNGSGLYFPYVSDLAADDTNVVPAVINEYFMQSLGSNDKAIIEMHRLLCRAWGIVGCTEVGRVLSHIAVGIRSALRAQGTCFPVFEQGVYEGFVLSGAYFTISVRHTVVVPMAYSALQTVLQANGTHAMSVAGIEQLAGVERGEYAECTTMRQLAEYLREAHITEANKDEIKRVARRLTYKARYWPVNATTLIKAMDLIRDDSTALDMSIPLHPTFLFSSDRVDNVMSAFGYQAPSFIIPATPAILLTKGSNSPKVFAVRVVNVEIAVADMKTVIRTKKISNNPTALSSKYQDRSFHGVEKDTVFAALKTLVGATDAAEPNTGGDEGVVGAAGNVMDW